MLCAENLLLLLMLLLLLLFLFLLLFPVGLFVVEILT